ncbi:putative metal-dependent hydrolases with the TIM-barrel fold [Archaeoglobus sulfaticallidus PM70-1]|uniref:Putative metal-dependent hydrolases with the TIM-barrel fold n=1 Tax=Archaeoglobus sulfaticallidus PM70-1 TaxID=387631 RepID=N0BKD8_9EURY|nr:TatD family hydrolase [Archaeoglobus sulfaticallidus]AGK60635.1 putative metal-dependent hydrolases with the TIM-barrel fold [Archaeoglobus sulfaticallidus PM70-1]
MKIYDTHTHSEGRSAGELVEMAEKGIVKVNTCAFYPVKPLYGETMIDLFRKLEEFEPYRGKKAGIDIYPAIGIHPRCIPENWEKVKGKILGYLENARIIGEIGLETANELEREVLKAQLEVAKKFDIPCIIHTPRSNKTEVTRTVLDVLEKVSFPEELAVIDHVSPETVGEVLKRYHAGLTVEEGKLNEKQVLEIVESYGAERVMLNSDNGFGSADYLSTYKTVKFLECRISKEDLTKTAYENAKKFFRV